MIGVEAFYDRPVRRGNHCERLGVCPVNDSYISTSSSASWGGGGTRVGQLVPSANPLCNSLTIMFASYSLRRYMRKLNLKIGSVNDLSYY